MRLRGHKTTALLGVVAVLLILTIAIAYLAAILRASRSESGKIACAGNLREIVKMGMLYADSGHRFFPIGRGTSPAAHESLNVMVAFYHADTGAIDVRLSPKLFVCRSWGRETAVTDNSGDFRLTEATCSYAWTAKRLTLTDRAAIASDKYVWSFFRQRGHYGGMNVAYTDASVEWVPAERLGPDELPEGLTR